MPLHEHIGWGCPVLDACVGFGLAVHFAKADPTPGLPSPRLQATSAVPPVGGLGTSISGVGDRAKIYTLKPVKPIHASPAVDKRVVPTTLSQH